MMEFFRATKSAFANHSPSITSTPDSLNSLIMMAGSGSSRLQGFASAISVMTLCTWARSCP